MEACRSSRRERADIRQRLAYESKPRSSAIGPQPVAGSTSVGGGPHDEADRDDAPDEADEGRGPFGSLTTDGGQGGVDDASPIIMYASHSTVAMAAMTRACFDLEPFRAEC